MALPTLTPESRAQAQKLSEERIQEGSMLLQSAQDRLHSAIGSGDHDVARIAAEQFRDGLGRFNSGVAAQKLLREGVPPQDVALQWLKQEMSLTASPVNANPWEVRGSQSMHWAAMFLLVAFALGMVVMYFLKMRRAAALFGRVNPEGGAPPPGSASPLAKGGPPSGPPSGPASSAPTFPSSEPAKESISAAGLPPVAPSVAGASSTATERSPLAVTSKWAGKLRVGSARAETPSVRTIRLRPVSGDGAMPFNFAPGQFLNVALPVGGARMIRSYSISSSPTQGEYVEITVKRELRGAVSRRVVDYLKVGDVIEAAGPAGRFTFNGSEAPSIVLIAGGVGITPMMSIIRYLTARAWRGDIFLVYACRSPVDVIFARDITELERANPKLHVTLVVARAEGTEQQGSRGRLTKELLVQVVPDIATRRIHVCGPLPMMTAVKAMLAELNVPPGQVKSEEFGSAAPTPSAAGTTGASGGPASGPVVSFSKTGKASPIRVDQTVLELSEELGVGIQSACRIGVCGTCAVKLVSGEVEMAVEDGLDADDRAAGMVLACQSRPKGPATVEA